MQKIMSPHPRRACSDHALVITTKDSLILVVVLPQVLRRASDCGKTTNNIRVNAAANGCLLLWHHWAPHRDRLTGTAAQLGASRPWARPCRWLPRCSELQSHRCRLSIVCTCTKHTTVVCCCGTSPTPTRVQPHTPSARAWGQQCERPHSVQ